MRKMKSYSTGWEMHGQIVAYPREWLMPVKTELWVYESLLELSCEDPYTQFFCFPWATLTDFLRQGKLGRARKLLSAIALAPPKDKLKRVTFCQHIYAMDLLPYFKRLGITDVYWSHKTKNISMMDGIRIHPLPLFPVMDIKRKKGSIKPLKERKYLYSFIGSYQSRLYLTSVRKWIFGLNAKSDEFILQRGEWHFENDVYRKQVSGLALDEMERVEKKRWEEEYVSVLEDSIFCLCPSGSGPNSIRLWEAPLFGSIPVLLSDSLCLKGITSMERLAVRIEESRSAILNLPEYLRGLTQETGYVQEKQRALNSASLESLLCEALGAH